MPLVLQLIVLVGIRWLMSSVHSESSLSQSSDQNSSHLKKSSHHSKLSSHKKDLSKLSERVSFNSSKQSIQQPEQRLSSIIDGKKSGVNAKKEQNQKYVRIQEYQMDGMEKNKGESSKFSKRSSKLTQNKQFSKLSECKSKKSLENQGRASIKSKKSNIKNGSHISPRQSQILPQGKDDGPLLYEQLQQREKLYSKLSNQRQSNNLKQTQKDMKTQQCPQSYLNDGASMDLINGPDLQPQNNSFHLNYSKSIDSYKLKKERLLFKDVLDLKYEGIDAHQKQIGLIQSQSLFKNILKSPRSFYKTEKRSVFQQVTASKKSIDSEYEGTAKFGSTAKPYEQSSVKQIEGGRESEMKLMQQRLKELQRQKKAMQMKLVVKQTQIRQLKSSSVYGSQKNLPFYNTLAGSNFWRQEKQSFLQGSLARRKGQTQFEKEIQSVYRQYLDHVKGSTFRKNLIRKKSLAYNSEQLQIGCLSQLLSPCGQNDGTLNVTLFITFHHYTAYDFNVLLIHDSAFESELKPLTISKIEPKKQYKMMGKLKVLRLPFHFPEIQVTYKASQQYSSKYLRIFLPLSVNKFFQILPLKRNMDRDSDIEHLRTNDFKLNSKTIPLDKISQYLAEWTLLSSQSIRDELILGATCSLLDNKFSVILNLSERWSWIQCWLIQGNPKAVQFFACTMKDILSLKKK